MTEQPPSGGNEESLEKAAEQGPLPGVAAEDALEERGQDESPTLDQEEKAEEVGRGTLPGGIAMH